MSYLLAGTGPVTAAGRTLTSDNAVEELLNRPYLELDAEGQDAFFEAAARAIFDAATEPVGISRELLSRASSARLAKAASWWHPFHAVDLRRLEGSRVLGGLTGDDDGDAARGHRGQRRNSVQDVVLPALPSHSRIRLRVRTAVSSSPDA